MKGPPPGVSWLGWNWAAGYILLKGQLRYWCMEGTWFVKTGEMIVYKSKDMERKPVLKEKKPNLFILIFTNIINL